MSSAWAFAACRRRSGPLNWLQDFGIPLELKGCPHCRVEIRSRALTELSFPKGTPARLSSLGFLPLVPGVDSDYPFFFGAIMSVAAHLA